jgi:hypothetical protein
MNKEKMIRNAMAEGFTREEAIKGYNKLKEEEVVNALKKERQPSEQLRDILDSKFSTGEEGRAGVGNANVPIAKPMIQEITSSRGNQSDFMGSMMKEMSIGAYKPTKGRAPVPGREVQFDVETMGKGRPRKGQKEMIAKPRDISKD